MVSLIDNNHRHKSTKQKTSTDTTQIFRNFEGLCVTVNINGHRASFQKLCRAVLNGGMGTSVPKTTQPVILATAWPCWMERNKRNFLNKHSWASSVAAESLALFSIWSNICGSRSLGEHPKIWSLFGTVSRMLDGKS